MILIDFEVGTGQCTPSVESKPLMASSPFPSSLPPVLPHRQTWELPPLFHIDIKVLGSKINLTGSWYIFPWENRQLCCHLYTCAFIMLAYMSVALRGGGDEQEEHHEQNSTATLYFYCPVLFLGSTTNLQPYRALWWGPDWLVVPPRSASFICTSCQMV